VWRRFGVRTLVVLVHSVTITCHFDQPAGDIMLGTSGGEPLKDDSTSYHFHNLVNMVDYRHRLFLIHLAPWNF